MPALGSLMTLPPFPHCPAHCATPLAGVGGDLAARPDLLPPDPRGPQSPAVWVMELGCPQDYCPKLQNASRSSDSL